MTIRSQGLFGVGLFLLGASLASSSFSIISVITMVPALVLFEFAFLGDLAVSIMAITASKKYGKKSLIFSTVLSGINTLLRAFAFTLLLFYLFAGPLGLPTASTRTNKPSEDEIRNKKDLPSDEFPSFAPGSDRPPRPHGPGGPGQRPPRPHGPGGPGGPGDCPPLPADLPPLPGPGELPPLPGDLPPFPGGPGGPGRPGHCGPGFPGGPGRPGHHGHPGGHEGQDPRDDNNEQHPRQGDDEQQQGEHQGPRRGREENENEQQPREHQGPRHGQDVNEQDDNQRESDPQNARAQQARKRNPSPMEISAPFIAWGVSMWSFGLNLAIFVLSIVHTRRLFLEGRTGTANTTTVNGKVYSELTSKV